MSWTAEYCEAGTATKSQNIMTHLRHSKIILTKPYQTNQTSLLSSPFASTKIHPPPSQKKTESQNIKSLRCIDFSREPRPLGGTWSLPRSHGAHSCGVGQPEDLKSSALGAPGKKNMFLRNVFLQLCLFLSKLLVWNKWFKHGSVTFTSLKRMRQAMDVHGAPARPEHVSEHSDVST